jgi:L-alanine-DL-glutamate epimerase-like enolase superfamily enzyme
MISNAKIIPLPPVDWGDNVEKETVLLEITSPEGITGLGSAYTGVNQLQQALKGINKTLRYFTQQMLNRPSR